MTRENNSREEEEEEEEVSPNTPEGEQELDYSNLVITDFTTSVDFVSSGTYDEEDGEDTTNSPAQSTDQLESFLLGEHAKEDKDGWSAAETPEQPERKRNVIQETGEVLHWKYQHAMQKILEENRQLTEELKRTKKKNTTLDETIKHLKKHIIALQQSNIQYQARDSFYAGIFQKSKKGNHPSAAFSWKQMARDLECTGASNKDRTSKNALCPNIIY